MIDTSYPNFFNDAQCQIGLINKIPWYERNKSYHDLLRILFTLDDDNVYGP